MSFYTTILNRTVSYFNVIFPAWPECRLKQAWYDILLGLVDTGKGMNGAVNRETLATRLHIAGKDIAQALTLNAKWKHATLKPHELSLRCDKDFL